MKMNEADAKYQTSCSPKYEVQTDLKKSHLLLKSKFTKSSLNL